MEATMKSAMEPYGKRIEAVREKMRSEGFGHLILGPSTNMLYFTGLQTYVDERLQAVVIPVAGPPAAVLPEMYRDNAQAALSGKFNLYSWSDQQDPVGMLKEAVQGTPGRIAVDDTLRADHLLQLIGAFPASAFEPASRLVDALRMQKGEEEIELMAAAAKLADQVMEKLCGEIRPGMSEKELALFTEISFRQLSDDISFKPIIAAGPNGASPHHTPGNRKLQKGDFIVVDCGGRLHGYCSDITRTFCLGKADAEMKIVYRAVQEANQAAFEAAEAGCSGEEADAAARDVITRTGFGSYFTHRAGHGIGLDVHEAPYLVQGNKAKLLPGNVFSVEPGIYLPGKYGVRIEDIVAITSAGARRLNSFNRDLIEL